MLRRKDPTTLAAPKSPLGDLEPAFPVAILSLAETSPGKDVMARQIEELLLLTCLGGFIAGITYAVTLLH